MKIEKIRHKGLRQLIEKNDRSKLPAQFANKIVNQVAFLHRINDLNELLDFPHWDVHGLKGDRAGEISLSVSKNYRLVVSL